MEEQYAADIVKLTDISSNKRGKIQAVMSQADLQDGIFEVLDILMDLIYKITRNVKIYGFVRVSSLDLRQRPISESLIIVNYHFLDTVV